MAERFRDKLAHAWNAFTARETESYVKVDYGSHLGMRPQRRTAYVATEKNIVSSIYTRLSIDVAAISLMHVRLDENDRYLETINSGLQDCLTVEANIDQPASAFRQDIAMSLFDLGVVGIVPVETDIDPDPENTGTFQIRAMRVGEVVSFGPRHVRLNVYNDMTGQTEEVTMAKQSVAIVENPFYAVMNEPNSTLKRLVQKLNLLDLVDKQSGAGKLDLIIQLPYVIKTETKRAEAEKRRREIEEQMANSQYGIAYAEGAEKITQLNRPVENQLLKQVEILTAQLYTELGLTPGVFDGTADEAAMVNYHNRTVEPIVRAITEAMKRTFLSKTARTQRQSIEAFRDPFKLVPISQFAEIADKFTRNEIMTANEIRAGMKMKPSTDPKADELRNSNMPIAATTPPVPQL